MNTKGNTRMSGYWKAPKLTRHIEGGCLLLGPVQVNWYGEGWRIYLTWPGRTRAIHFG